jgi:hypothetical protein
VDLERAIAQSKTQPKIGSIIGARRTGSELVRLPRSAVATSSDDNRTFRRARWLVESVTFFAEAAKRAHQARELQLDDKAPVRAHPELKSAFISLHVAQKYAAGHIANAEDRELFVKRVRELMAASIGRGEPPPEPRLRAGPEPHQPASATRTPGPKERDEPKR